MKVVTYTRAKDGRIVTESEATDEAGALLDGFNRHVCQPVVLRDGVPVKDSAPVADAAVLALFDTAERDEVRAVFDALASDDADRLDWGWLEANRMASRERGRGNAQGAAALEGARDAAAARLRNRAPTTGSSEEARASYVSHIGNAWKGDAA
jgi:hypothetical protein